MLSFRVKKITTKKKEKRKKERKAKVEECTHILLFQMKGRLISSGLFEDKKANFLLFALRK